MVMLTRDKLDQVGAACEAITAAAITVQELLDDEPTSQPPTLRAQELRHVVWDLYEQRRQVQELWS